MKRGNLLTAKQLESLKAGDFIFIKVPEASIGIDEEIAKVVANTENALAIVIKEVIPIFINKSSYNPSDVDAGILLYEATEEQTEKNIYDKVAKEIEKVSKSTIAFAENKNKTYHGIEILELIKEGKLKTGTPIFAFDEYQEDMFYILEDESKKQYIGTTEDVIDSWDLLHMSFKIVEEKQYMTFNEARVSGKRIKHKDWTHFCDVKTALMGIYQSCISEQQLNSCFEDAVWEVE